MIKKRNFGQSSGGLSGGVGPLLGHFLTFHNVKTHVCDFSPSRNWHFTSQSQSLFFFTTVRLCVVVYRANSTSANSASANWPKSSVLRLHHETMSFHIQEFAEATLERATPI